MVDSLPPHVIADALNRHARGDWGELDSYDWQANEGALTEGGRLFSIYRDIERGVRFYVITEADRSVVTDSDLALITCKRTGFYRVPSLRGLWYRGFLERNGSTASREDWFGKGRLQPTSGPTGWNGPPGATTRAAYGHESGLELPEEVEKNTAGRETRSPRSHLSHERTADGPRE